MEAAQIPLLTGHQPNIAMIAGDHAEGTDCKETIPPSDSKHSNSNQEDQHEDQREPAETHTQGDSKLVACKPTCPHSFANQTQHDVEPAPATTCPTEPVGQTARKSTCPSTSIEQYRHWTKLQSPLAVENSTHAENETMCDCHSLDGPPGEDQPMSPRLACDGTSLGGLATTERQGQHSKAQTKPEKLSSQPLACSDHCPDTTCKAPREGHSAGYSKQDPKLEGPLTGPVVGMSVSNKRMTKDDQTMWAHLRNSIEYDCIVSYCNVVLSTVFRKLKIPLVIVLVGLALMALGQVFLWSTENMVARARQSATAMICQVPLVAQFDFCPRVEPTPDSRFVQLTGQDEDLSTLQYMAAEIAALPRQLHDGQYDVQDMVFLIVATNFSSKEILVPLLEEFTMLLYQATDRMHESLASSDALIENTIIINSWAEDQLRLIEGRRTHVLAPLRSAAVAVGLFDAPENELATVFGHLVAERDTQAREVVQQFEIERKRLGDQKEAQDTVWNSLLRDQSKILQEFDSKMMLCKRFYDYTRKGDRVVATTIETLSHVRARLAALQLQFRNALPSAPGAAHSLQLTISSIRKSIENLETSRTNSQAQQAARLIEHKRMRAEQKMTWTKGVKAIGSWWTGADAGGGF